MPLQKCKRSHTSSEFVFWKVRMDMEVNEFHRMDYFLAQIAWMILMVNSKDPDKIEFDPFLLKFISGEEEEERKVLSAEERMLRSQRAWGMALGVQITSEPSSKDDEN